MIRLEHVTFTYPAGHAAAVDDVTLEIRKGEMVGIVGPNGSGKSTLSRLMKGLLLPDEGSVLVDDLSTATEGIGVRRLVGYVFQNPNSQIVNSVVEQEVAFGPENLGLPTAGIRHRVDEALDAVGLVGQADAECHNLSMADKQRVAIASVMAMDPGYLILDEATAWIEPVARWEILDRVMGWASSREIGLVLVTHRMDEAQLCQRLLGMLHGRIEVSGSPEDVLRNRETRTRLALALPEAYLLAQELRAAGLPVAPGQSMDRLAESLCQS